MAQYIPKDALVAEIDRLENKLYYEPENFKDVGAKMALDSLKSSLDTLEVKEVKEEPVSEELEYAMQHNAPNNIGIDDLLYWRNGFISGAKWQKAQMMKDAVGGKVISYEAISFPVSNEINRLGLEEGDKIKVIILKDE